MSGVERSAPPAHARPITVEISRFWSSEEALAVFELIDDLRNKIWALYSDQLQALLCEQCTDPRADDRDDAIDTLPF